MTLVQLDEMVLERCDHDNGWSVTVVYARPKGHPKNASHKPTAYIDAEMLVLTGPNGEIGTLDKQQTRGLLMRRMEAQRGNSA